MKLNIPGKSIFSRNIKSLVFYHRELYNNIIVTANK